MERGEGVINVVFVCCEEKTEGEITGYEKQDALSQPRQKRQNLRDVFFRGARACCLRRSRRRRGGVRAAEFTAKNAECASSFRF